MSQESIKVEKIQAILDDANKKMVEVEKRLEEKVAEIQQMTRESPGTGLTLTFLAGLTIGGIIALVASKKYFLAGLTIGGIIALVASKK